MNNTYILISRKLIESGIFSKPPLYLKLWMWLLVQANFADNNGLKRGQVRTTYAEMREAMSYYVGFRKVKPSKSEVFRALEYMRGNERDSERNTETPMIETVKTTRHILVTICNYNDYQDPDFYERNDEDTANETSESLRPVTRINKKDNNNNKKKNNKKEKVDEVEAFIAKCPEEMHECLKEFAKMRKTIKKPLTAYALQRACTKAKNLANGDIPTMIAIFDQSTERSYQGVFPLAEENKPKPQESIFSDDIYDMIDA